MQYDTLDVNLGTTPPEYQPFYNRPRDVPGPGITRGHFMRNPGSDWRRRAQEQRMRTQATGGLPGPELEIILKAERDKEREEFRDGYITTKSNPKMMQGYVQILAKLGMKAVERDLKRRQELLRQLLVADELRWESLEKEKEAQQVTDRLAELKRFTEQTRAEQEAKRLQLVAEKREQQDRQRIDLFRVLDAKKNLYDCKETNLCQMRDKQHRLEAEREVTRLYCELGNKLGESQMIRDQIDARRTLARNIEQMDALRAQIAYQQNQNQTARNNERCLEVERIKLLQEQECREKEEARIQKIKNQEEERASIQNQITYRRRILMEDADKEAAEIERVNRENREILQKENIDSRMDKMSAKVETKMFLTHVAAIKAEQVKQEKRTEEMIEKKRKEIEERMDKRRCEESAARRKLISKTLEERARQVKENEEMKQWEEEMRKEEREEVERLRECQKALRAEYEQRVLERKKQYAEDLRNQLRFSCVLKEREEEEKQRFWNLCQEEDEKYQRRVEELMNKPQTVAVHPFRLKIEGRAV